MRKLGDLKLPEAEKGERLLKKAEVAAIFRVTTRTIEIWMAAGFLVYFKIGRNVRFKLEDVLQHLREHHQVN